MLNISYTKEYKGYSMEIVVEDDYITTIKLIDKADDRLVLMSDICDDEHPNGHKNCGEVTAQCWKLLMKYADDEFAKLI